MLITFIINFGLNLLWNLFLRFTIDLHFEQINKDTHFDALGENLDVSTLDDGHVHVRIYGRLYNCKDF